MVARSSHLLDNTQFCNICNKEIYNLQVLIVQTLLLHGEEFDVANLEKKLF